MFSEPRDEFEMFLFKVFFFFYIFINNVLTSTALEIKDLDSTFLKEQTSNFEEQILKF